MKMKKSNMKMKKSIIYCTLALFLLGLVATGVYAHPFGEDGKMTSWGGGDIRDAIKDGDFDAWLAAIDGSPTAKRMTEVVTEDNFEIFMELHQAMTDREWETVKALSDELGLERPEGRNGFRGGPTGHGKDRYGPRYCDQN